MIRFQILKKFVIPSSIAAVVIKTEVPKEDTESKPCRPSELPLYEDDICACRPKRRGSAPPLPGLEQATPGPLEEQIRVIRKELWVWHDRYRGYRDRLVEKIETAKAHSESTLAFLKEEGNYLPRIGAISLGGLTGIIFGLRGGWIRRITYGATGSLAMSALCYPRQASEVSQEALTYAKKYVAVTYNFIYGVKPEVLNTQSSNPVASDSKHSSDAPSVTAQKDAQVLTQTQEEARETEQADLNPLNLLSPPTPGVKSNAIGGSSPQNNLNTLAEQSSDVTYWGFRLF